MSKTTPILRKDVISWSLYDFANTIFSMNILSLYFKRWIVEDLGRDGLNYDLAYSASMLLAGLLMPALGAISDHSQKKKLFLFLFTFMCCLTLGLIPFVPPSVFMAMILLFGLSNFFYEGGMVFYNPLLYSVSGGKEARLVSGFGVALGYTGSIIGMILVLPWVTGELFGVNIPLISAGGKTASFIPSAVIFFIFALPLFLWVKEKKELVKSSRIQFAEAYRQVWEGLRETKKYPGVLRFLVADHFIEDAIATVILNIGIFSSIVLDFSDSDMTLFLIISTVSAMGGSYLIGRMSQNLNLKRVMILIIWGWILTLLLFMLVENRVIIYIIGSMVGVLLGGIWTVSRPLLAEMVPPNDLGRFFGLYSLSGRSAAMVGPVIWGLIVYFFSASHTLGVFLSEQLGLSSEQALKLPYRLAVFSLIAMMATGLIIFRKIPAKND